ncbi:hypothetical protein GCM10009551_088790 [Nocardiopsis tropica]
MGKPVTYRVIHKPHVCAKPNSMTTATGTVIQCDTCGQQWRLNYFPCMWVRVKTNIRVIDDCINARNE